MSDLFENTYRIPSTRLAGWDYGSAAYYFVTICTHNRGCYFGNVWRDNDGAWSVVLSPIGKIVRDCWLDIPEFHPYVVLDVFIIMPNHMHAILQINKLKSGDSVETRYLASHSTNKTTAPNVFYETPGMAQNSETPGMASLQKNHKQNQFGPQSHNLASIIRGYKSAVTMYAKKHHINFTWQPRFYDHIIRTPQSLENIQDYIRRNPWLWPCDRNNPDGLLM